MAKFEQVKKDENFYYIPLDRGAKAMENIVRPAIEAGVYVPKKGETPAEMKKKNEEMELESMKKGIGLPRI